MMANEAHAADGTINLHVHGLFVSPKPCSDEVLKSTIYPANWNGSMAMTDGCQTAAHTLTYTYDLPEYHPAGLYWYHTHRHGESEHETQMGLVGAIVVEDKGDAYRRSIGVTDEVLVVDDVPNVGCVTGAGMRYQATRSNRLLSGPIASQLRNRRLRQRKTLCSTRGSMKSIRVHAPTAQRPSLAASSFGP